MIRRTLLLVLFALCAPFSLAIAQTYPSQPTFQKCGVGLGPNTTELTTLWGGPTPFGACWIAQQTNGDGGFIGYVVRSTGVDPTTNLFMTGVSTNGDLGEFYLFAPWGNVLEAFSAAGGTNGVLSLGVGNGTNDEIQARSRVRLSRNSGFGNLAALAWYIDNAATDEKLTQAETSTAGFRIVSLDDTGGAGATLLDATRSGTDWNDVLITSQAGDAKLISNVGSADLQALTGQATVSGVDAQLNATTTASIISSNDVTITGGASGGVTTLGGSATLRLGTAIAAGNRILFDDNTSESIDYDIRGALGNTAGDLQIFTRTQFASGTRNDSYFLRTDTDTGMVYPGAADTVGFNAGGSLAATISASAYQQNGSCNNAASPCFSFVVDPDTGVYRSANNTIGLVAGGTEAVNCTSTVCTFNGDVTVTGALTATVNSAYGGFVDSAGTGEVVPSGWSAVRNATGDYTVSYPFTLANAHNIGVSCTVIGAGGQSNCAIRSMSTTSFSVETVVADTVADTDWSFTAVRIQ